MDTELSAVAVVFPGQGSQRPGMAADFVAEYVEANTAFEEASEALGFDVAAMCHGDDDRLNLTEFTQPCIVTAEIAMLQTLHAHFDFIPTLFAGHSLGEYSALVAARVMPFTVALRLVRLRGQLMQKAVAPGVGAMIALVMREGLPLERIRECAAKHSIDVANENSPAQVVLSGESDAVGKASDEIVQDVEGIRATPLNVSAPFHSRLMATVEPEFRAALEEVRAELHAGEASAVMSNTGGGFHTKDPGDLIDALTRQISHSVRWTENMRALCERSNTIVEVGPNRPLRGFFKTLGVSIQSVIDLRSARRTLGGEESA